jgi:hypothetical protein
MSGMTTGNTTLLTRSEVWSRELKEILRDELMAQKYVRWLQEFPDGDTFKIPSIGQAYVDDYAEDESVKYRPLDTGQFTFQITEYLSSGTYVTKKAEQDMFYMNELVSRFVPEQERAIMEHVEETVLGLQSGQTAGNANTINGVAHRYAGSGSASGTMVANGITLADFARANLALNKANVSANNRVAIVDPSAAYLVETLTNLSNVSNNPMFEGIVSSGIATGMRFVRNVYGFDVYTSQRVATIGTESVKIGDQSGSAINCAGFKANLFFSADASVVPFIGAWRQMPEVDTEYNKDFQRTEFVTTARYGVKLYRPENLVVVLSNGAV